MQNRGQIFFWMKKIKLDHQDRDLVFACAICIVDITVVMAYYML